MANYKFYFVREIRIRVEDAMSWLGGSLGFSCYSLKRRRVLMLISMVNAHPKGYRAPDFVSLEEFC
jgi:hypothetical protein